MIILEQKVERLGNANYEVTISTDKGDRTYTYSGTNEIYACYKSIMSILCSIRNDQVLIKTNIFNFAAEINGIPSPIRRLNQMFGDLVARNNLAVRAEVASGYKI